MSGGQAQLLRRGLIAGAAAVTLGSLLPLAHAAPLDDLLKRIAEARRELKTLRADFVQTRTIGLLATEVKSKGRLTLAMPDRLRWDLLPPDDVTYWLGPKGLTMKNSEGIKTIGKSAAGRFAAVLDDLRVMLGGDLRRLRKRYTLSVEDEKGKSVITAIPKGKPEPGSVKKQIRRLVLVTDPKKALVERVTIVEQNGDQSVIAFDDFVKNAPVKKADVTPPTES